MTHISLRKRKWDGDPSANRDKFIGGSDVGTVLGLNPYKSAYALWAEKTGRIVPEDISDKEAVWWGNELEGIVAKRFTMKTGIKVRKTGYEFYCEEYPFLIAHIDRQLCGISGVLECKTTSSWNKFNYEMGEIPPMHHAQCQFYMLMTGTSIAYLATKRDNQFYVNLVRKDREYCDYILQKCIEFWKLVEEDKEPEIDGSDSTAEALAKMYGKSDDEEIADISEFDDILDSRDELASNISTLKEIITEGDNKVKAKMMTATKGISERHTVIWKTNKNGVRTFKVTRREQK